MNDDEKETSSKITKWHLIVGGILGWIIILVTLYTISPWIDV